MRSQAAFHPDDVPDPEVGRHTRDCERPDLALLREREGGGSGGEHTGRVMVSSMDSRLRQKEVLFPTSSSWPHFETSLSS